MNRYDSYKNADLAWLKEVPSHWEIEKTKRFFRSFKEINKGNKEKNVLSLTYKGVIKNNIDSPNGLIPASYETYQIFEKNDLVFKLIDLENVKTSRVGLVKERGIMSSAYIRLKIVEKVNPKYAYYYFLKLYIEEVYNNLGYGVRSTMSSYDLCNIDIPIPPLSEQKQIADYLDWKINEIDKLINVEREKVNQLEIYKQKIIDSLMYSINSTYIPLKVVFNFGKGLNITKDNLGENGIRCISYGEIHNNFAFSFSSNNSKLKGLERVKGVIISKFAILQKGDFIFVDTSEDLKGCGNFTYLEDNEREVYAGYHTIVGKLKLDINSRYLAYYFESNKWRKQIRETVNGIKVYSITQSILKSSKIQIPKKEVQNQIVEKIDRFMENQEKLISIINEKIDNLISLKQSLISEVVTGKIDVRDIKIPYYEKIDISNEKQEHLEERQV